MPKDLWTLERWARRRSHIPPAPPKIPPLATSNGGTTATHAGKAAVLARRFFPNVAVGPDYSPGDIPSERAAIDMTVTAGDIQASLTAVRPWKSPGHDGYPAGFLKACGPPLFQAAAVIATASLRTGYFPHAFKRAIVVVLAKPGKTKEQLKAAGGWRPISLLSCLGKAIEAVVAQRLTALAEASSWLPDGQFGNRHGRSTETAARFLTQAMRTAWA